MQFVDDLRTLGERDWDTDVDTTLRVALVGLGGFARGAALPSLADADYCDPTVFVTGSADEVQDLAAEHDIERVVDYEAYAAGEASDAYDAVYVATPNALHREHVEAAADLGKGVVSEKPIADTVANAEAAVETCERAGVPLMTAYRMQLDPVMRRLRDSLPDLVGDVNAVHSDFTFEVMSGSRGPDQWRIDPDLAGGGALYDVGVYPLNTARFLLGEDPVAVSGRTRGDDPYDGTPRRDDDGAYRAADRHVAFRVDWPDCTGSFTANFSGQAGATLTVVGSEGRIHVENAFLPKEARHVTVERDEGTVELTPEATDEMREEFDYFAHQVATDGEIEPDGQDGLTDVRALAGVLESAATGERVEL
ncbi:D-xylose 1-dehydrogenase Gfo6 [Halomarina salina]|uniref:D-xylose 1-dehydrogenase Gfo6 n=1 Tax=Halomarina salina TaxID=1872699 RepID=A0ABD5RIK6_9EURY|nr:D-xylose 1-dehydrogenase Gfo6 [Halomarina salina]